MGEKKILKTGLLFAALLLSLFVSCNESGKQNKQAKVYQASFINGTGKTISSITLTPKNVMDTAGCFPPVTVGTTEIEGTALKFPIDLQDKKIGVINLPVELKSFDILSLEVEFDNEKNASMKKHETISLSSDSAENVFLLSLKGKKSTVPLVAAGTAGGVTAATIAGTAAYCVAQWGAGGLTWLLASIGGTMVGGVLVVASIPVAITAVTAGTIYAIQHFFMGDTLVVQKLTKDQAVILPETN